MNWRPAWFAWERLKIPWALYLSPEVCPLDEPAPMVCSIHEFIINEEAFPVLTSCFLVVEVLSPSHVRLLLISQTMPNYMGHLMDISTFLLTTLAYVIELC